jgi:hypothetical protein
MTVAARGPVDALRRFRAFLANGLATARRDGAATALRIGLAKLERRLRRSADGDARDAASLQAWRERYVRRPLVVLPPLVDWDMTLFQRPQHMARALAEAGFLYLFCVRGERDRVAGLRELAPGLALTDRFDLVSATMGPRLWHVYSTDLVHDLPSLRARMDPGDAMIYEYIDRIDDAVARRAVPAFVHTRHAALLADPDVAVVASADALAEEVRAVRRERVWLVENGVDVAHWRSPSGPVPGKLATAIARGRPIVGYFGAIAAWFDVELVHAVAKARPQVEFVVIGPDYDGARRRLEAAAPPNLQVVGPVPYADLPSWASHFAAAMIPFRVDAVTAATSPLKLFEFLACGLPVVATDLRECRKSAGVSIATGAAEFAAAVDAAIARRHDPAFAELALAEAVAAGWVCRARAWTAAARALGREPQAPG